MMFDSKKNKKADSGNVLPLADGVGLSLAGKRYNCNVLRVGGNRAQRTLLKLKQMMSTNASFIVTDPSGELYRQMKETLEKSPDNNVNIRAFNPVYPDKGNVHYNPFAHITRDADIYEMADVILANTSCTAQNGNGGDLFFEKAERQLLNSILFLVYEFYPKEEQTLKAVSELIDKASLSDPDGTPQLDKIVENFSQQTGAAEKESAALKLYKGFVTYEPVETRKTVAADLAARLAPLKLDEIRQVTSSDDIDLYHFNDAERQNMLFVITSAWDPTAGWFEPLLYTQLMSAISYHREKESAGRRVIFFADTDITVIPGLDIKTALMRQNDMSIVLETSCIERFKEQYPSTWKSISANCNVKICYSRATEGTAEWMSEICGVRDSEDIMPITLLTKDSIMNLEDGKCIIKTGHLIYDVKPAVIFADDYDWDRQENPDVMVIPYDLKDCQGDTDINLVFNDKRSRKDRFSFFKWLKGMGDFRVPSLREIDELMKDPDDEESDTVQADDDKTETVTAENIVAERPMPPESTFTDKKKKADVAQYDEKQEDMEKKTGYYGGSDYKAYTVNEALKIIKIKEERVKKLKEQISQGLMVYLPLDDAANAIPKDVGDAIISRDAAEKARYEKSEEIKKKIFLISRENEAIADIKRQIRHFDAETVPEEQKIWNTTIEELKDKLPALREQKEFLQKLVSRAQEEQYVDKRTGSVYVKKPLYSIEKLEKDLYALEFKIAYMEESIEEAYTEEEAINIKGEIYI